MRISFFFSWYDFWIGLFYDGKSKILYICPLPCLVFKIEKKYSISPLHDKSLVEYSVVLWEVYKRIASAYGVPPELIDTKKATRK